MTMHTRLPLIYDFTRAADERILLALEMRKVGYKSRSIGAMTGFNPDYCRTIAQRVADHDIRASTGADLEEA